MYVSCVLLQAFELPVRMFDFMFEKLLHIYSHPTSRDNRELHFSAFDLNFEFFFPGRIYQICLLLTAHCLASNEDLHCSANNFLVVVLSGLIVVLLLSFLSGYKH